MSKIYAIYSINDIIVKDIVILWEECKQKTSGKKSTFKSFSDKSEAVKWFNELDKLNCNMEVAAPSVSTISFQLPEELYLKVRNSLKSLPPTVTATEVMTMFVEKHLLTGSDVTYGSDVQASQELLGPQLFNQLQAPADPSSNDVPPWKI